MQMTANGGLTELNISRTPPNPSQLGCHALLTTATPLAHLHQEALVCACKVGQQVQVQRGAQVVAVAHKQVRDAVCDGAEERQGSAHVGSSSSSARAATASSPATAETSSARAATAARSHTTAETGPKSSYSTRGSPPAMSRSSMPLPSREG